MNYNHQQFCETWVDSYDDSLMQLHGIALTIKHGIAIVTDITEVTDLAKSYIDILNNNQLSGIRIQKQTHVEHIIDELLENGIHVMMYHKENPGQVFVWIHSNEHVESLIPYNWTDDWQMILFNDYGEDKVISEFTARKWWELPEHRILNSILQKIS